MCHYRNIRLEQCCVLFSGLGNVTFIIKFVIWHPTRQAIIPLKRFTVWISILNIRSRSYSTLLVLSRFIPVIWRGGRRRWRGMSPLTTSRFCRSRSMAPMRVRTRTTFRSVRPPWMRSSRFMVRARTTASRSVRRSRTSAATMSWETSVPGPWTRSSIWSWTRTRALQRFLECDIDLREREPERDLEHLGCDLLDLVLVLCLEFTDFDLEWSVFRGRNWFVRFIRHIDCVRPGLINRWINLWPTTGHRINNRLNCINRNGQNLILADCPNLSDSPYLSDRPDLSDCTNPTVGIYPTI